MSVRSASPLVLLLLSACWSGSLARESADAQVYPILEDTARKVTGEPKTFALERPVDNLRQRLLTSKEPVQLSLLNALDIAAENSRDYQRQKEQLYLAALNLTRSQHDFEARFGFTSSAEVSGESDTTADASIRNNLSSSVTTVAGTTIVASFVNTFLRSLITGGGFDGSDILNLTISQPLLRGAGARIVREPLTQSERDVVYQMRDFERFRAEFSVRVVSDYYGVVQAMENLRNTGANYESLQQSRLQIEELFRAGRRTINDLGRAQQGEYTADNGRVVAKNRLEASLDRFKLTLGLPVTAPIDLDPTELDRLVARGVVPFDLDESQAIGLAVARRFDHRTVLDEVEDAARRVAVSEDALSISLDFSAALNVPAESGRGLNLDWSKVNWAAGFDLDLALDKLAERNSYRSSLISLDVAMRNREQSEDQIAADVRTSLRNIKSAYDSYKIQVEALRLALLRVESTEELYAAGRTQALEVLDAKDSLLQAQLNLTAAIVDYSIARLELMRDLEGIALEPKGLRFDPALPVPETKTAEEQP